MTGVGFDPSRISDLRAALSELGVHPSRGLGQNFLVDGNILDKIVAVAGVSREDTVLEVGAGAGALSRRLAQVAGHVIAIEIDRRLEPLLRRAVAGYDNVQLIFADALDIDWGQLNAGKQPWRFVANVPYYITGPLLSRALQAKPSFQRIVMMVQREVAQRLVAAPGSKDYGALSVLAAYYATVELAFTVSPRSFWPRPQVWSAVVVLNPVAQPAGQRPNAQDFFAVVRAAFAHRRKMLHNALADDPALNLDKFQASQLLAAASIDGTRRAETLSLDEFARLAAVYGGLRKKNETSY